MIISASVFKELVRLFAKCWTIDQTRFVIYKRLLFTKRFTYNWWLIASYCEVLVKLGTGAYSIRISSLAIS